MCYKNTPSLTQAKGLRYFIDFFFPRPMSREHWRTSEKSNFKPCELLRFNISYNQLPYYKWPNIYTELGKNYAKFIIFRCVSFKYISINMLPIFCPFSKTSKDCCETNTRHNTKKKYISYCYIYNTWSQAVPPISKCHKTRRIILVHPDTLAKFLMSMDTLLDLMLYR